MSQENVEIVRQVYEAFNRGDWDAVYRDLHPDFEMTTPPRGLDAGIFRGREEGQGYWEDFFRPYEAVTVEPVEFFESGDQLVVFLKTRLRPRGSSAEVEVRTGTCGRSEAARLCPCESSPSARRPSKPPGFRSRRCRRRT